MAAMSRQDTIASVAIFMTFSLILSRRPNRPSIDCTLLHLRTEWRLVFANETLFEIVRVAVAEKIAQRDEAYADYQIPDDLTW